MSEELAKVIEEVKDALPPPPAAPESSFKDKDWCACGKMVPVSKFKTFNTGKINAIDNVCAECDHHTKGMAVLVCHNCALVVARMPEHSTPKGFKFEAGKSYHLTCCGACDPEGAQQGRSIIAELAVYYDSIGYKA